MRRHFCESTARLYGRVSLPRKTCLNGTMPAFVKSRLGSFSVRREARGTTVWPRARKKSRKPSRIWSPVTPSFYRLPPGAATDRHHTEASIVFLTDDARAAQGVLDAVGGAARDDRTEPEADLGSLLPDDGLAERRRRSQPGEHRARARAGGAGARHGRARRLAPSHRDVGLPRSPPPAAARAAPDRARRPAPRRSTRRARSGARAPP